MRQLRVASYVATPNAVVLVLVAANVFQFLLCCRVANGPIIPTPLLVAHGALVPTTVRSHELWRLLAAGFLHADPTHLLANMVSLLIIGPFLERRLGATTFALVYLVALFGAGLASLLLHQGFFVGVGASGAIFGILGALFALWALGDGELSPGFFLVNFGLNFGVSARNPHVDWAAHIGGLIAGMGCVALLDILSRANVYGLRCKFPEFVKFNATLIVGAGAAWLWFHPLDTALIDDPRLASVIGGTIVTLCLVKLLDLLLAVRHGLVGVVLVFVVSNAAVALMIAERLRRALALQCGSVMEFGTPTDGIAPIVCPNLAETGAALVGGAILLTLLAHAAQLRRGLRDVGFCWRNLHRGSSTGAGARSPYPPYTGVTGVARMSNRTGFRAMPRTRAIASIRLG